MPRVYVQRSAGFNAAHRLHNPERSEEWNRNVFSKCNSPNFHGHNYTVRVTVAGEIDPDTGYVMDLSILKRLIAMYIVDECDHKNLNLDVGFLKGINPTAENLAVQFWKQIKPRLPNSVELYSIKVIETDKNSAEYRGDVQ